MLHKKINSKRGSTHYWISRNESQGAECIVFTHGVTANHIMFEKQVEFFRRDYTVITWDVPCHGESRPYTDFSFQNTALELQSILDSEGILRVILVGMSMGGYPCQEFAIQFPSRVMAFIALDTTPIGFGYTSSFDRWCVKHVKLMAKCFPRRTLIHSMAKSVSKTEYSYKMMIRMLEPFTKDEIIQQMDIAYNRVFDRKEFPHFNFPVLILLGEHDKTGKVKEYCESWSEDEGYPLRIIKDASHFSNGDNPGDVNREIHNFIINRKQP